MATVEPREPALRRDLALSAAIEGVSAAFASLGRVFLCLDDRFQVLHASSLLDRLISRGAAAAARGRSVAELLGAELFGPSGTMRQLLLAGERREGWRSMLTIGGGKPRLVSLTAAPFHSDPGSVCDPRVAYILVLRPAEEDQAAAGAPSPFPGGEPVPAHRRADRRRHQRRPATCRPGGPLPRGPFLPPEGRADRASTAACAPRGHRTTRHVSPTFKDIPRRAEFFDAISQMKPEDWTPNTVDAIATSTADGRRFIVKAVNYDSSPHTLLTRLQGSGVPASATVKVVTVTAGLDEANSLAEPEKLRRVEATKPYLRDMAFDLPPYTVALIEIRAN